MAALYVDTARGPYAGMPGVDCWGFAEKTGTQLDAFAATRDAMQYPGTWPVVAHPPCGPWGRFHWHYKGGEGGKACGLRAVEQVRRWGGVLEHPSGSRLWATAGLPLPGQCDSHGGWTLAVEQVDWGHPARKPTWLYVVGTESAPVMPLKREPTHVMVRLLRNNNDLPELRKADRHLTPPAFAHWLVRLASGCRPPAPTPTPLPE